MKLRGWLRTNLKLYALLGDSTRGLRERLGLADSAEDKYEELDEMAAVNPDLVFTYKQKPINTILSPSYRRETIDLNHPIAKEGFEIHKKLFSEMDKKLKERNKKFVIAIIPTKEAIYGKLMTDLAEGGMTDELKNTVDITNGLIQETLDFCVTNNIYCHDMTADLAGALKNNVKQFSDGLGSHPLAAGYREMAKSIYGYLAEKVYGIDGLQ